MSGGSRALLLSRFGEAPRLQTRQPPEPSAGETLVSVQAAQLGHLDLGVVDGSFGILPALPCVPGTEAAGVVVSSAVHPVGSPVRVRGKGIGLRRDGGWADHLVAPDAAVLAVAEGTDPALACSFFSPAATAYAAVHDVGQVSAGQRVAVTGAAGAVGSLTVQLAARAGADVLGIVGRPEKLSRVPAPARAVLAPGLSSALSWGSAGHRPVDVLVDTVGGRTLHDALEQGLVRPGGRVVLVGYTAGDELTVTLSRFLLAEVSLLPLNLMSRASGLVEVGDRLLAELGSGELHLAVEEYGLDEFAEAADRLRRGAVVGKAVLRPA